MTAAQLTACRENAQFSTGSRTPEGKKRSFLNAFRHGLTGQIVIHTPMSAQAKPLCAVGKDEQAFKKHCDGIREAFAPVGALELDLAQAIAEDRCRLNRTRALENSIFALGQSEHLLQDSGHPEVDAPPRPRPHLDGLHPHLIRGVLGSPKSAAPSETEPRPSASGPSASPFRAKDSPKSKDNSRFVRLN